MTWLRRLAVLLGLGLLTLPAQAAPLSHQFYVWNRAWSPAVVSAVSDFADTAQGWRVLVAESDAAGRLKPVAVNWKALAATGRPVTAVIRIDGQLSLQTGKHGPGRIGELARGWPAFVAGVEIDHDAGVARLAGYGRFLRDMRRQIGSRRLSITALPAWLRVRGLDDLVAATDEIVLQVHAVRAPGLGLFDADLALRWTKALADRGVRGFRIAVPDYGSRIVRDEKGVLLAVESEMPRLVGGASAEELMARPADVARFVRAIAANPPRGFAGLVWFRLPTWDDTRIWTPATLRAVMRGEAPQGQLRLTANSGSVPGAVDIMLRNDGDHDLPLPSRILLPRECRFADAVNGYALRATGGENSFVRLQNTLLRAHHHRIVGWARCRDIATRIRLIP